jgi:hypothetical protein
MVFERAANGPNAAPTEMMLAEIGAMALAGWPADFSHDDIGVVQDTMVQERDHFEI